MNLATIIGFISGLIMLVYATYSSTDSAAIFFNLPGLAIVLGGVTASLFICYPLKDVARVISLFFVALKREDLPIGNYIHEIQFLARQAASKGTMKLEGELNTIENYFLQDGLQMLVDQRSTEEIKKILGTRIENTYNREMKEAEIFRMAAKLAPAFGLNGTLIGLIAMLQTMGAGSFDQLGPGMAVALTTTFYGVILSNLVFQPVAVKVERRIEERCLLMEIIMEGVLLIQAKTPAAIVLDKLKSYLPPRKWASIKPRQRKEKALSAATAS